MSVDGSFDHFLLTRFSAVMALDAPPATEEWLRYRLAFFYDACLPSVLSQRDAQPFEWLVLLDDRCSDEFRADVEGLSEGAFTPLWSHEPFRRESFAQPVADRASAPYLITTRIDSDDAMAVDFMARVQAQFAQQDQLFVNFPRGLQIDRSGAVYRSTITSSPFLSLIERRFDGQLPATVYTTKHARARGHAPVRQVQAPVMWAQVVHGTNVSNIVNGTQAHPRIVGERFDIGLGYDVALRGRRLLGARAAQLGRLGRLWAGHPGELVKRVEAVTVSALGTRTWPQDDGESLADRVDTATRTWRTTAREGRWAARERLNSLGDGVRHVAGDLDSVLASPRVVIMAEWSRGRSVRSTALRAAQAYATAGWPTLIVAAREPWVRLRRSPLAAGVALVQRPNSAYDFGSWRDALDAYPALGAKDHVLLTNDSLEGPIGPLDGLLSRLEASAADVWSATQNHRPRRHMQSYLLAFRHGHLASPAFKEFFAGVKPQPSKTHVVRTYEFGLSTLCAQEGLSMDVGWPQATLGLPDHADAVLAGWDALLDQGFPFVKRTLLTDERFAAWRPAIAARMRSGQALGGTEP